MNENQNVNKENKQSEELEYVRNDEENKSEESSDELMDNELNNDEMDYSQMTKDDLEENKWSEELILQQIPKWKEFTEWDEDKQKVYLSFWRDRLGSTRTKNALGAQGSAYYDMVANYGLRMVDVNQKNGEKNRLSKKEMEEYINRERTITWNRFKKIPDDQAYEIMKSFFLNGMKKSELARLWDKSGQTIYQESNRLGLTTGEVKRLKKEENENVGLVREEPKDGYSSGRMGREEESLGESYEELESVEEVYEDRDKQEEKSEQEESNEKEESKINGSEEVIVTEEGEVLTGLDMNLTEKLTSGEVQEYLAKLGHWLELYSELYVNIKVKKVKK